MKKFLISKKGGARLLSLMQNYGSRKIMPSVMSKKMSIDVKFHIKVSNFLTLFSNTSIGVTQLASHVTVCPLYCSSNNCPLFCVKKYM